MDSKIFSLFKYIDMFGIPPLFTIRGHQTFQTTMGSILTIFCVSIMIIYASFFFKQMIYHSNPTIITSIYNDEIPKVIKLTNKNFSFAFGLQNKEYTNYIDESIYVVKGVQSKVFLKKNGSSEIYQKPIKIIKCNEYKFDIIPEYFGNLPLDNLYCLNDEFYELEGEYKREIYSYIKLNFSRCENSTENNFSCKPLEVINDYLTGGFIGIFMIDYSLVPRDFKNPYLAYGKNLYNSFSNKFFVDLFLYLKNIEIVTDEGYFFNKKKKLIFGAYDYLHTNIDHRIADHFLSLTLRLSSKREIHERSYIKLQTIFSNFGGMLKIILLFGEYSIYFIRMTLYKNYILEFFNLDESEIRLKKIRKKYNLPGNLNLKNHTMFSNMNNIIENNNSFIVKKNNNDILESNLGNIIEENSESKSFTNSKIKNSFILTGTKKTVQNNYLLKKNEFLCEKSKSKENKNTFNLLYRNSNKEEERKKRNMN